ncbi:MAG: SpoIID/LytB domain-containing protein [Bacteroidales bacterium]|nr:SpoIID/LytB domain-containing protein [Bacteroidales bacterium]
MTGQVTIRIFANQTPESALFSVTGGEYKLNFFPGGAETLKRGELVLILKYDERIAVKTIKSPGFICDSVLLSDITGNSAFTLRLNSQVPERQSYSGDLKCFADFGTLVFLNTLNIDSYIAGVVRTEGGSGRSMEYLKTQAVIARTYMHKYFSKHAADRYNLCDNTHCQAFNGVVNDSLIRKAVEATKGQVILTKDSVLIISAFHSNCGGETSASEDVWLTGQSYLKSISDPYCRNSPNARWRKSYSTGDWISYLNRSGLEVKPEKISSLNFSQSTRLKEYCVDSFSIPLIQIRSDLGLRSTYFSVIAEQDSVVLEGKGYGHGAGLCQEGAMEMAARGFDYIKIIEFYYPGVIITDIQNCREH